MPRALVPKRVLPDDDHRLVADNLQLVHKRATKFARYSNYAHIPYDDLFSAGAWGLAEGACTFDPGLGHTFGTYVVYYIDRRIREELFRSMLVRVPTSAYYRGSRPVTYTGYVSSSGAASHDDDAADGAILCKFLAVDGGAAADLELCERESWDELVRTLSPRYRLLLRMLFCDGKTLEQAGKVLGVTRERVRQLRNKALKKLRARMAAAGRDCG